MSAPQPAGAPKGVRLEDQAEVEIRGRLTATEELYDRLRQALSLLALALIALGVSQLALLVLVHRRLAA